MTHILKLIQGSDRRNPTRSLDLFNDNFKPVLGGFAPGPGKLEVVWSGRNGRTNGQQRVSSTRDNIEVTLKYDIHAESQAHLARLQGKINAFCRDVHLYEEDAQAEPIWLAYMWGENGALTTIPPPLVGQWWHYARVIKGEPPRWSEALHSAALINAEPKVIGMELELTLSPWWCGAPQRAFIVGTLG